MTKRFYLCLSLAAVVGLAALTIVAAQGQNEKREKDQAAAAERRAADEFFPVQGFFGEGSYLGVFLEDVTQDRMKELGLSEERGVIVMKVAAGSPAEKAGLKENDVIVSYNGTRVDSLRQFQRMLAETPADRKVSLEVIRGGAHQTLSATLTRRGHDLRLMRPEMNDEWLKRNEEALRSAEEMQKRFGKVEKLFPPNFGDYTFVNPGGFMLLRGIRLGVSAESLTSQLAEYFGVKEGRGVLITQVDEGGAASRAGLKAGDVIVEVDGQKVENMNTLAQALFKKEEGAVTLKIVRNRAEQTVTVQLEKPQRPPSPRGRVNVSEARANMI